MYYVFTVVYSLILIVIFITIAVVTFSIPYVPVPKKVAKKMIELSKLSKGKKHYDLGSGDGRLLFEAAKTGAYSVGYELQWPLVLYTKLAAFIKREKNVKVHLKNLFKANFSDADAITMYILPRHTLRISKMLEEANLKHGTKIISYAFSLKDWEPVEVVREGFTGRIFVYEIGATKLPITTNTTNDIR